MDCVALVRTLHTLLKVLFGLIMFIPVCAVNLASHAMAEVYILLFYIQFMKQIGGSGDAKCMICSAVCKAVLRFVT